MFWLNDNNIPRVIAQLGGMYTALYLPCEGREIILDRPLTQVKHIKISKKRKFSSEGTI